MNCTCPNCGFEIKETTQEFPEDVIKVYQFKYEHASGAVSTSNLWYDSEKSFHELNSGYSVLRKVAMKTIEKTELREGGWAE
jgi:hypothetical protein